MKMSVSLTILLIVTIALSQTYQRELFQVLEDDGPTPTNSGSFHFDSSYVPSGSVWELDWSEDVVFNKLLRYTDPNTENCSYELRMGKGGQIYSFRSPGFGEALPPQFRPSYNESGANISDPGKSDPIKSHHGNWAVWNDEVWQLVGSDQKDSLSGSVKTQNIHQAGPYMNNYAHRKSDLSREPFYSPMLQSFYDENKRSYSAVFWGQSENPAYVYDAPYECDTPFPDLFRPSVLYFQKHSDIGDGAIQVDFLLYNFHRTRGIDFWNVPFLGIRNSSLPFLIVSNSASDGTSYEVINSKAGHPDGSGGFLPEFKEGAVIKTSGNGTASSGWFAFSSAPDGNGPTLAFVTAKESQNPPNGYGDLRYGTAMNNHLRDVTIFSRRALGGSTDPVTGLKQWGIVGGHSIRGRYFILLGDNIETVVEQIKKRELITSALLEKERYSKESGRVLHFQFIQDSNGRIVPKESLESEAEVSLHSTPFSGSYPVFLITTDTQTVLSSDPYYFSLKPYDGIVKHMELLGFSDSTVNKKIIGTTPVIPHAMYQKYTLNVTQKAHIIELSNVGTGTGEILLTNCKGQEVSTTTQYFAQKGTMQIDISNLASGIYFLKWNQTVTHFIKQ